MIIDIASQYFPLKRNSHNSWQIDDPNYDSVILFEDSDTYHRFSSGETGNVYKFLSNIVGLDNAQILALGVEGKTPNLSYSAKMRKFGRHNNVSIRSNDLEYNNIVGVVGYNDYMAQRHINQATAEKYALEIDGDNVLFPLYNNDLKRIGCIKRFAHARKKNDRYRTFILSGYDKPCCWDMVSLSTITPDKTIVLVEGTWSVLRIDQVVGSKYNILPLATMGTNIEKELFDYIYRNKVIAILDNDTGGNHVKNQLTKAQRNGMMVKTVEINVNGNNVYVDDISDTQMLKLFRSIM